MMNSQTHHRRPLVSSLLVPALLLAGCSGLSSEEEQNVIGMCEALDDAYVEQGDFYSALSERSDLNREEAEVLFAESVELATTISNYTFGLQAAAIASEGENSDFAQAADELVRLAWRLDDNIENRTTEEDLFLRYGISMRMVLGDCKERGAEIETQVF